MKPGLLPVLASLLALSPAAAGAQALPPLRIGMTEDLSTSMASVYGKGAVAAAQMAVEDWGPEVIGRRIELLTADGQSKPDIAAAIVREWFDKQDVQMVTGLSNSAIGLSAQSLAREKNRVSIVTGSGATEITGSQCSPNGLHWVIDTYAINRAVPVPLLAEGNKKWFLLVANITLGKVLVRDLMPVLAASGGTVVGEAYHPLFTTDISSPVVSAQSSGAQVVALMNVGGDLVNAAKQASEFGVIAGGQKLAGFWMTVTDVQAIGLQTAQGIYFAEAFIGTRMRRRGRGRSASWPGWARCPTATKPASRPVRLSGTVYCHKSMRKSYSKLGFRSGRSAPSAMVCGRSKAYRPRKLICLKRSGETLATSA